MWFAILSNYSLYEVPKIWRRNGQNRNKCPIWAHHTQTPLSIPIVFALYEKKIFGTWETLHSHCFGHVTWKLWIGRHAEFISLQSTGQAGQSTESLANQWNGGGVSLGQLLMCCCHSDFSECDLMSTLVGQQSSTNHPQLGDTTPLAI